MISLLFLFFVNYAVKCDDLSSYYVIEMPEYNTPTRESKPFYVYWNVPTMQCQSKGIPFQNLYEKYGIIQNSHDRFRGEKISILYDPGDFPALLKNESSGKFKFRNGGVPQEGNINEHLDAFRIDLDSSIPDRNFNGLGIIDFESWRPVFRQNFGVLSPYRDVSLEIEKKKHWWWPRSWLLDEARARFETAARQFMQTTVSVAKQMRPRALWGYYGYPYCFNMANNHMEERCANGVIGENDNIHWLWSESTGLYPSVYTSKHLTQQQLAELIHGRVREAERVKVSGTAILPYFWYKYREGGFLSKADLVMALKTIYEANVYGMIMWGSSNDVNTVEKCVKLRNYLEQLMGPAISEYTKHPHVNGGINYKPIVSNKTTEEKKNLTATLAIATLNNLNQTKRIDHIVQDPEFQWLPPANYIEDISQNVENMLRKTSKSSINFKPNERQVSDIVLKSLNLSIINDIIANTTNSSNNKSDIQLNSGGFKFTRVQNYNLNGIKKSITTKSYPKRPEVAGAEKQSRNMFGLTISPKRNSIENNTFIASHLDFGKPNTEQNVDKVIKLQNVGNEYIKKPINKVTNNNSNDYDLLHKPSFLFHLFTPLPILTTTIEPATNNPIGNKNNKNLRTTLQTTEDSNIADELLETHNSFEDPTHKPTTLPTDITTDNITPEIYGTEQTENFDKTPETFTKTTATSTVSLQSDNVENFSTTKYYDEILYQDSIEANEAFTEKKYNSMGTTEIEDFDNPTTKFNEIVRESTTINLSDELVKKTYKHTYFPTYGSDEFITEDSKVSTNTEINNIISELNSEYFSIRKLKIDSKSPETVTENELSTVISNLDTLNNIISHTEIPENLIETENFKEVEFYTHSPEAISTISNEKKYEIMNSEILHSNGLSNIHDGVADSTSTIPVKINRKENVTKVKKFQVIDPTSLSLTSIASASSQVSGSATSQLAGRKYMFCLMFYLYSFAKCLCDIYRQCS